MIARVVTKRDDARLALFVTGLGALALLAVLCDDLSGRTIFRPPAFSNIYLFVASLMVLAAIGPWLAWTRRGRATQVTCSEGLVEAGALHIARASVTALSIATAARGRSIAIRHGNQLTFLEVERAEDASRIAAALGTLPRSPGELRIPRMRRILVVPQALFAATALACAPLYYFAATHVMLGTSVPDSKALFGVGGVIAAELTMLVLLGRRLLAGHAVGLRRGAWDAHAALHGAAAAKSTEANERERSLADGADRADRAEDAPPALVRVFNLARGDERVRDWLARLDAMPTDQHAYRGDAMKKDVLWETLGDGGATVSARMGAARVLRRRYGEEEDALVRVVDDPEVRVRVAAALEENEDAERHLETLGPLFRAR